MQKHPDGFKLSQFKYWYNEWTKEVSPVMHFTHKAGDKLFIDFCGKKLTIVDRHTGELQGLEVFVCVLGSSQYWTKQHSYEIIKQLMIDAGISEGSHRSPKGLRHAYGVNAISKPIPLNMLQKWLGRRYYYNCHICQRRWQGRGADRG